MFAIGRVSPKSIHVKTLAYIYIGRGEVAGRGEQIFMGIEGARLEVVCELSCISKEGGLVDL